MLLDLDCCETVFYNNNKTKVFEKILTFVFKAHVWQIITMIFKLITKHGNYYHKKKTIYEGKFHW